MKRYDAEDVSFLTVLILDAIMLLSCCTHLS